MISQRSQHLGKFIDVGATATEFGWHAGLHQPSGFEIGEVFFYELIFIDPFVGAAAEDWTKLAGDIGRSAGLGGFNIEGCDGVHDRTPSRWVMRRYFSRSAVIIQCTKCTGRS